MLYRLYDDLFKCLKKKSEIEFLTHLFLNNIPRLSRNWLNYTEYVKYGLIYYIDHRDNRHVHKLLFCSTSRRENPNYIRSHVRRQNISKTSPKPHHAMKFKLFRRHLPRIRHIILWSIEISFCKGTHKGAKSFYHK